MGDLSFLWMLSGVPAVVGGLIGYAICNYRNKQEINCIKAVEHEIYMFRAEQNKLIENISWACREELRETFSNNINLNEISRTTESMNELKDAINYLSVRKESDGSKNIICNIRSDLKNIRNDINDDLKEIICEIRDNTNPINSIETKLIYVDLTLDEIKEQIKTPRLSLINNYVDRVARK